MSPDPFRVRGREAADLPRCAALLRETHERDGYPTYWPTDPEGFVAGVGTLAAWVAELSGPAGARIVGHAALGVAGDDPTFARCREATGRTAEGLGVVARVFVAPEARGRGVAGALMDAAEAEALRRGLHPVLDVVTDDHPAIALYERRGYRRVGSTTLRLREPPGATLPMWLYVAGPDVAAGPVGAGG